MLYDIRRKAKAIAILTTGAVAAAATIFVIHKIRRRRSHFLPPKTRAVLEQLLIDHTDVSEGHAIASKVFDRNLGRLTDKQLIAVYAAVQVGSFVKQAGFDPLHPDPVAFAEAAHTYTKAELTAPATRNAILTALSEMGPSLVKAALRAALEFLG